jgi:hypothetical protein
MVVAYIGKPCGVVFVHVSLVAAATFMVWGFDESFLL